MLHPPCLRIGINSCPARCRNQLQCDASGHKSGCTSLWDRYCWPGDMRASSQNSRPRSIHSKRICLLSRHSREDDNSELESTRTFLHRKAVQFRTTTWHSKRTSNQRQDCVVMRIMHYNKLILKLFCKVTSKHLQLIRSRRSRKISQ